MVIFNVVSIFIVAIATLMCLAIVLFVIWEMPDVPNETGPELCLPKLYPDGTLGNVGCHKSTFALSEYLNTRASLQYKQLVEDYNRPEETRKDSPISLKQYIKQADIDLIPVARLIGQSIPKDREDNSAGMTPFKEWYPDRELHYHGGFKRFGVKVRNGRLVVPVSGLYDLYSFFVFYEPCKPETGEPNVRLADLPLKHSIFKFDITEGRDTEVVQSVQPLKVSVNRYINAYNSYISSVVRLTAGDEISVKVSNITYLSTPGTNFMGLKLL